ncbi:MAG: lysylphosphatidylglycerol synthase domain-containing protein [Chitinophagaceae bacterium]
MMPVNKNIKIFFNYYLGLLLFIWLSFTIYHQIKNQPHLETSWYRIKHVLQGEQSWKFWVVFLLMFLNWGVEARKWQVLLQPVERMSIWKAFKATLAGVAFSINTPNRIGEYGGRILYVKEGNRIKAVSLTIVGSISQLIITIILGWGGLIFLLKMVDPALLPVHSGSYSFWIEVIFYLLTFGFTGLLFFYFRLNWVVMLMEKVPAFSKICQSDCDFGRTEFRHLIKDPKFVIDTLPDLCNSVHIDAAVNGG